MDLINLRKELSNELDRWCHPSLAVAIMREGEILLEEAFGFADVEQKRKADRDTLYQIGSCTKSFTAACIGILVDRGMVDWDAPIKRYLPWIAFRDKETTEKATVRDLLCHRTGLPRHDAYWYLGPFTRKECVENLANMQPLWKLGEHWCYQNTCYIALGMLIEAVSGMSWESFVEKELIEPLGMTRTTFYREKMIADSNHAEPYARFTPKDTTGFSRIPFFTSCVEDMSAGIGTPIGPAGSIMSTLRDMETWLRFFLNGGVAGTRRIISSASMEELLSMQMPMEKPEIYPYPELDRFAYAMGWFTEYYRGCPIVEHGGYIDGFSALVAMQPEQKLGFIALTNLDNSFITYAFLYQALDAVLGYPEGDWHSRWRKNSEVIFAAPEETDANCEEKNPSYIRENYLGTYRNPTYGQAVIGMDETGLTFLYNTMSSPLRPLSEGRFIISDPKHILAGLELKFLSEVEGKTDQFSMDVLLLPGAEPEVFTKENEKCP